MKELTNREIAARGVSNELQELANLDEVLTEIGNDAANDYRETKNLRGFHTIKEIYELKLKKLKEGVRLALKTDEVLSRAETKEAARMYAAALCDTLQLMVADDCSGFFAGRIPDAERSELFSAIVDAVTDQMTRLENEFTAYVNDNRRAGKNADDQELRTIDPDNLHPWDVYDLPKWDARNKTFTRNQP